MRYITIGLILIRISFLESADKLGIELVELCRIGKDIRSIVSNLGVRCLANTNILDEED